MKTGTATMGNIWRLLKKLKIELLSNSTILLLGIRPKELKSRSHRNICIPMSTTALFTITKIWGEKPVFIDRRMDKEVVECIVVRSLS